MKQEEIDKIYTDTLVNGSGFARFYIKDGELAFESLSIEDVLSGACFTRDNKTELTTEEVK